MGIGSHLKRSFIMKQNKFWGIAALVLVCAVIVTACKGPNDPVNPSPQEGFGNVSINFGGNARTLLPSEIAITKLHYVLTFTQTDGSGQLTETQNGSGQLTLQLNAGTWNLVIRGYNSPSDAADTAKALVSYIQNGIVIQSGGNVTINAKLLPNLDNLTQNGSGTLRYDITFPAGAAGVLKVYTYPAGTPVGNPLVLSTTVNSGELELASGYYNITVNTEYQGTVKIWSELILINDNAITEALAGPDDFTDYLPPPGPVSVYLSIDKFTMTDEGAGIFSSQTPIVLLKGTDSSETIAANGLAVVEWRVGDAVLGTENSITLDSAVFPMGTYTLNLTFVKNGRPWLGSLTFEVTDADAIISVTNTNEWINALSEIRTGGNNKKYVIRVFGDVEVPGENNNFGSVNNLSITLEGNGRLALSSNGSILSLSSSQNLVIDSNNLTLQGLTDNNGILLHVNGTLELKNGTITGNNYIGTSVVGGIYVQNGIFIMSGGTISGNTGGNIYLNNSTFTMSGGTITGNTGGGGGGGVDIGSGSTFTMTDGSINGNTGYACGGVCVRDSNGTFIMSGGTISSNNSINGDNAVYTVGNFTMSGGIIGGNSGNGIAINYGRTFTMTGGTISGNGGSGVNIREGATFIMSGGTISGNFGSGVYAYNTSNLGSRSIFTKLGGGVIYGNEIEDFDENNVSLKNTINSGNGHAVYWRYDNIILYRNTTLGISDNISTDDPDTGWGQ
jgi:hypothetical protein